VRKLFFLVTGTFWAVMMASLVRMEILPYLEYQEPPSYRTLLQGRREAELLRRTVWLGRTCIGSIDTLTQPLPNGAYTIHTRSDIDVAPMLEEPLRRQIADGRLRLLSMFTVDPAFQLDGFQMDGRFMIPFTVQGTRLGPKLTVQYDLVLARGQRTVDYPRDAVLADSLNPHLGGGRLSIGKRWKIQMVDLGALVSPLQNPQEVTFKPVYATVEERESILWQGRQTPTMRVDIRRTPTEELPSFRLWVDEAGKVLVEEMVMLQFPLRVVLEEVRTPGAGEAADVRRSMTDSFKRHRKPQ
jgi:hypothetical protein